MKSIIKIASCLALCAAPLTMTGCISAYLATTNAIEKSSQKKAEEVSQAVKAKYSYTAKDTSTNLTPSNSTLIVFSKECTFYLLQQNSKFDYTESVSKSATTFAHQYAYMDPVPVGSEYKITSIYQQAGKNIYYANYNIQGVDFTVSKPGIQYVTFNDLYTRNASELDVLKNISKEFENTAWAPVIQARIKELSK